jgi:WD40 repeat protein
MGKWVAGRFAGWRKHAWLWFAVCAGLLIALGLRLNSIACPWEVEFSIPSGYDPADCRAMSGAIHSGAFQLCDLTSDGRLLAVGRPGGLCEVWDLETRKRISTLGEESDSETDKENPTHNAPHLVRFSADGRRVVVSYGEKTMVYDPAGKESPLGAGGGARTVNLSPKGKFLATVSSSVLQVFNVESTETLFEARLDHVNSAQMRLQWTDDGRHLLLNDYFGVRVWDVGSKKLLYFHRELDLRLPPPMIADVNSGVSAPFSHTRPESPTPGDERQGAIWPPPHLRDLGQVATLTDSKLSPAGDFIVSIYGPYTSSTMRRSASNQEAHRVRFYDTVSGELLWDKIIARRIAHVELSNDGTRLYVHISVDFSETVQVYDVKSRKLLHETPYRLHYSHPARIAVRNNGPWIAASSDSLWLVDTENRCASVRLREFPSVTEAHFTPKGDRLVEMGRDAKIRIWRERRPISQAGAYGLYETWGLYAIAAIMVVGVLSIAGLATQRETKRRLPKRLWITALLFGLLVALSIASEITGYAVNEVYQRDSDQWTVSGIVISWAFSALWILTGVKLLRLRRRWRKFMMVLIMLGIILATVVTGILIVALVRVGDSHLPSLTVHGMVLPTGAAIFGIIPIGLAMYVAMWFWLRNPRVRAMFKPEPDSPDGASRPERSADESPGGPAAVATATDEQTS